MTFSVPASVSGRTIWVISSKRWRLASCPGASILLSVSKSRCAIAVCNGVASSAGLGDGLAFASNLAPLTIGTPKSSAISAPMSAVCANRPLPPDRSTIRFLSRVRKTDGLFITLPPLSVLAKKNDTRMRPSGLSESKLPPPNKAP